MGRSLALFIRKQGRFPVGRKHPHKVHFTSNVTKSQKARHSIPSMPQNKTIGVTVPSDTGAPEARGLSPFKSHGQKTLKLGVPGLRHATWTCWPGHLSHFSELTPPGATSLLHTFQESAGPQMPSAKEPLLARIPGPQHQRAAELLPGQRAAPDHCSPADLLPGSLLHLPCDLRL